MAIIIKKKDEPVSQAEGGAVIPAINAGSRIRILIAGDDATRTSLMQALEADPETVFEIVEETAHAGEALIDTMNLTPDILLLDLDLQSMDGIDPVESLQLVTSQSSETQVIVLSSQTDANQMRRAMMAGARDLLSKPFTGDAVRESVHRVYRTMEQITGWPPLETGLPGSRTIRTLGFAGPRQTKIFTYEEKPVTQGTFRVDTLWSGLSAGTEMTYFAGTNQYLNETWNERLKLFMPTEKPSQKYPVPVSGYMTAGRVVETASPLVNVGEIVCGTWGHRSGHKLNALRDNWVRLPEDIDPVLGIYVAQMGPICGNAVLHADDEILGSQVSYLGEGMPGQSIMVFGAGVVGLLTALMAQWGGARQVAIVDRVPSRLERAATFGLIPVNNAETDPALWAKYHWVNTDTLDRGADIAFQCTASDVMLNMALRSLRPQGTVVDMGFYQGGLPNVNLGEVFHHNGLRHICAQIRRMPRRLQSSWGRRRLSEETIRFLRSYGDRIKEHVITNRVALDDGQQIFEWIANGDLSVMQVVFHP